MSTPTRGSAGGESGFEPELDAIRRFYEEKFLPARSWSALRSHPYLCLRQRQRRLRQALLECGIETPERIASLDVLDVGCGGGASLAWLLELGADPARCTGIDLIESRVASARARIAGVRWLSGDFTSTDVGGPFDLVMLVAVLTSVPNAALKQKIVDKCFAVLRPGGIFFFYDLMSRREDPGTPEYKRLTYPEVERYVGGRRVRWFKRDYLDAKVAERVTSRFGIAAAELLQATKLFNIEASFAYVRA